MSSSYPVGVSHPFLMIPVGISLTHSSFFFVSGGGPSTDFTTTSGADPAPLRNRSDELFPFDTLPRSARFCSLGDHVGDRHGRSRPVFPVNGVGLSMTFFMFMKIE